MIRLSQYAALEILPNDVSRDLDTTPLLHVYQDNDSQDKLLVQGDTSPLPQMSREHAVAPFMDNVLLGTDNFYPEQGLSLSSYHSNSTVQELLNDVTLPIIEYKQAILYFSQGSVAANDIVGHNLHLFVDLPNGSRVSLCNVVDFLNDSQITAQTPKLFESQIWNEGLLIEFIDVEYLVNSGVADVQEVKELIFGTANPLTIGIEYSSFTNESVDNFEENSYQFTRLNVNVVNEQSMPITITDDELYASLEVQGNGFYLLSTLAHDRFDIESYMNTLKSDEETYVVKHRFVMNSYTSGDLLLSTETATIINEVNVFDELQYRPILPDDADHCDVDVSIQIENIQTGLIITRSASTVITNANIQRFIATDTFDLSGAVTHTVKNVVQKEVNQIVHTPELPQIVEIEKKLYVQAQQLDELVLFDAPHITEINTQIDISGQQTLYLKIGQLLVQNEENELLKFSIPQSAWSSTATKYLLLNSDYNVISSGQIHRQ